VRSTAALIALCLATAPAGLGEWISGVILYEEPCSAGCRRLQPNGRLDPSIVSSAGLIAGHQAGSGREPLAGGLPG